MKLLYFAPFLAPLALGGTPATRSGDVKPASYVQVSIHSASRGNAVVNEVAIATLPGDPLTTFDVDGDRVTLTHYCR